MTNFLLIANSMLLLVNAIGILIVGKKQKKLQQEIDQKKLELVNVERVELSIADMKAPIGMDGNPKRRGAIFLPKTDLEEAREQKIAENMAEGKDTTLEELS